jgi:hypothetical protein
MAWVRPARTLLPCWLAASLRSNQIISRWAQRSKRNHPRSRCLFDRASERACVRVRVQRIATSTVTFAPMPGGGGPKFLPASSRKGIAQIYFRIDAHIPARRQRYAHPHHHPADSAACIALGTCPVRARSVRTADCVVAHSCALLRERWNGRSALPNKASRSRRACL